MKMAEPDIRNRGYHTTIPNADTRYDSDSATTLINGDWVGYYDPCCFDHRRKEPQRQGKGINQRKNLEKMVKAKTRWRK